jgi:hypothetical protein
MNDLFDDYESRLASDRRESDGTRKDRPYVVATIAQALRANGVTVLDVKSKALLVELEDGSKLMIGTEPCQ